MTGFILYGAVGVWFVVAALMATLVFRILPKRPWRIALALILFLVLIPLPLIDEIVGKSQFEQLCSENSTIQIDRATAVGKTVYYAPKPRVEIEGTWVRVILQPWRYVDAKTGELVLSYNTLEAVGGRFIRLLGISEGGVPLTFYGSCGPRENVRDLVKSLQITALDRPKESTKGD